MKIAVIAALALAALGISNAATFKTIESPGVQMNYSARASDISSHTVVGYVTSWSVTAIGGAADFEVKHSTIGTGDQNVNLSSTIYVLSGQSVSDTSVGMMKNALILITRIDQPGATVYVDMTYLKARSPEGF